MRPCSGIRSPHHRPSSKSQQQHVSVWAAVNQGSGEWRLQNLLYSFVPSLHPVAWLPLGFFFFFLELELCVHAHSWSKTFKSTSGSLWLLLSFGGWCGSIHTRTILDKFTPAGLSCPLQVCGKALQHCPKMLNPKERVPWIPALKP